MPNRTSRLNVNILAEFDLKRRLQNSCKHMGNSLIAASRRQTAISCWLCKPGCTICLKSCYLHNWCAACDVEKLAKSWPDATSGDERIDDIIQRTQRAATGYDTYWEWIKPDRLTFFVHLADGGFGSI